MGWSHSGTCFANRHLDPRVNTGPVDTRSERVESGMEDVSE